MRLQGDELERIKEWMTGTEDKISRLGRIGSGPREVEAHLREHEDIQREFEEREVIRDEQVLAECVLTSHS